ncbi:MAG TPA: response regulator, partial [Acetivibrio sp.]|nr:response regulator [Acetivibrio sp.]
MRKTKSELPSDHKIIVVDDERGILDSLSVIINRLGYRYTGVNNPLEAIETIKREDFDLLVLDFLMEPLQGDEVVREIRKFNKDIYI